MSMCNVCSEGIQKMYKKCPICRNEYKAIIGYNENQEWYTFIFNIISYNLNINYFKLNI